MAQARQIEPIAIPLSYRYSLANNASIIPALWTESANDSLLLLGGNTGDPNAMWAVRCRYNGHTSIVTAPGFNNAAIVGQGSFRGRVYKLLGTATSNSFRRGGFVIPSAFGAFTKPPLSLSTTILPNATNDYAGIGMAISARDQVMSFFSPGGTGAQQRPIINQAGAQIGTLNDGFTLTQSQDIWGTSGRYQHGHINPLASQMRSLTRQSSPVTMRNIAWSYAGAGNVAVSEIQSLDDGTFNTNFSGSGFRVCGSEHNGFFCRIDGSSSFAGQGNNIIWLNASGTLWRQVQLIAMDARAATVIAQNNAGQIIAGEDGHYYYKNTQSGGQNNGLDILASPPNTPKLLSLSVFRNLPPYGHFDVPLGVKD